MACKAFGWNAHCTPGSVKQDAFLLVCLSPNHAELSYLLLYQQYRMTGEYKHFGCIACVINPSACFACKQAMALKIFKTTYFYTRKNCLFAASGRSLWYYIVEALYSKSELLLQRQTPAIKQLNGSQFFPSKLRAQRLFIYSKDLCSTLNQQIFRGC